MLHNGETLHYKRTAGLSSPGCSGGEGVRISGRLRFGGQVGFAFRCEVEAACGATGKEEGISVLSGMSVIIAAPHWRLKRRCCLLRVGTEKPDVPLNAGLCNNASVRKVGLGRLPKP
jgi:hypothetical protein